ncbi:hypothetical protein SEUCBS139899_003517 [Sporothrix eucalyptigena]|uniref:Small ribosomal subunit protein mS38 n=1 Tax=Sporothrix eucalyptigena TaxID=1812306 RepID=A0ABP0APQ1_9PEZI
MFPSVRRVVASSAAAPPAAAALVRSGHWSAQSASASVAQIQPGQTIQPSRGHQNQHQQRRYSSSKPSSPDNGSKALPGVPSRPSNSSSSASSSSSSNSSSSFKRKRKAKQDAARPSVQKLPSVPSTQHLPAESLALSTFFSQHRPISITHSLPKIVTDDAFAAIFAPRRGKSSDVIRTLSRAVDDLEGPMVGLSLNGNNASAQPAQRGARARQAKEAQAQFARQQLQQQLEEDAAAAANAENASSQTQLEFKNADGSDAGIYVQLNSLSGQFLPFQPPPPPVPEMTEAEAGAEENAASTSETAPNSITFEIADGELTSTGNSAALVDEDTEPRSTRVFKAILTIEEQLDDNGEVRIVAHSPQILEEGAEGAASAVSELPEDVVPRSFFERMALRQLRFEDALQRQRNANSIANGSVVRHQRLPSAYHDGTSGLPHMMALSVKRQKKLKMKKKKYKKLMKRTRTLRRKLDRT